MCSLKFFSRTALERSEHAVAKNSALVGDRGGFLCSSPQITLFRLYGAAVRSETYGRLAALRSTEASQAAHEEEAPDDIGEAALQLAALARRVQPRGAHAAVQRADAARGDEEKASSVNIKWKIKCSCK